MGQSHLAHVEKMREVKEKCSPKTSQFFSLCAAIASNRTRNPFLALTFSCLFLCFKPLQSATTTKHQKNIYFPVLHFSYINNLVPGHTSQPQVPYFPAHLFSNHLKHHTRLDNKLPPLRKLLKIQRECKKCSNPHCPRYAVLDLLPFTMDAEKTRKQNHSQPKTHLNTWADRVKVTDSSTRFTLNPLPRYEEGRKPEIIADMLTENAEQWEWCMVGIFPSYKMNYHTVNTIANRIWKTGGLVSGCFGSRKNKCKPYWREDLGCLVARQ